VPCGNLDDLDQSDSAPLGTLSTNGLCVPLDTSHAVDRGAIREHAKRFDIARCAESYERIYRSMREAG